MKEIVSLKRVLLGLACAGALNGLAFAAQAQTSAAFGNVPLYFEAASDPAGSVGVQASACSPDKPKLEPQRAGSETGAPVLQRPLPAFGSLPLYFEAVPSQVDHATQFIARGVDCGFLIAPTEAQFSLKKTDAATQKISLRTVQMQFVGAGSQAQIHGTGELPGKINYLVGNNPGQWRTGVPTFGRVQVDQLYPGVNLVYYGNQRQLEYDFSVAPGANPAAIGIRFDGVDKISVGAQGELILTVGKNEIVQRAPVIYQMIGGARKIINGGYRILDRHAVAFAVGKYDHRRPLVIDPVLSFSTYFGGNGKDAAKAIALDTNGFIYIAGNTLSPQFPTNSQPNGYQTNFAGGGVTGDAFVAKFDNQGSNLVYFTYLGGSGDDIAYGLVVDAAGHAYVAGTTDSANFPVTNAIPGGSKLSGTFYPEDVFVTELGTNGSHLVYSTYLGGADFDAAYGVALDSSNDTYITGITYSTNFPTTSTAFQQTFQATNWTYQPYYNANAFVSEIAAGGSNLLYSSYLGGTNYDTGMGIAVDSSNNIYVTGFTASTNFPTTNAVLQTLVQTNLSGTNLVLTTNFFDGYLLNGSTNTTPSYDAFVARFAPSFTNLIYSTLLGGTNNDLGYGIVADTNGNAYVVGETASPYFPDTATSVPGLYAGVANNFTAGYPYLTNAFLTQITWNGANAAIGYSAVFGGTNDGVDAGQSVALDPAGDAFVVGSSSSTSFPVTNTPGLLNTANAGGSDAFVIGFNTNCSAILYSGYLGGSGNDYGYGIAVDAQTNVYIAGQTASGNFPTFQPFQASLKGASDAFLAKIGWANEAPVITNITVQPTNEVIGTGVQLTFNSVASGTPPLSYHWQLNGTNLVNGTNIFGATNATMTIYPTTTNTSGSFRLVVTNYAGAATSSNIVVTVTASPVITQQPTNYMAGVGSSATFQMNGYAAAPFVFQWFKDGLTLTNGTNASGSIISGATNYSVTIRNVQTNDAGNYWFTLTNNYGAVTSDVATLTVVAFPTITAAPTNQTVGLGSAVTFSVTAIGTSPLSYQWQKNGNNVLNNGHISGGTSPTLSISSAQMVDAGGYSVIITNVDGSVTSSPPAVLTVLSSPLFGNISTGTNGGFILSGVGGISGSTYYVLTSTNLATPLAQWTPIATNQFGSQGQFTFTNLPSTNTPQEFYLLQSPP